MSRITEVPHETLAGRKKCAICGKNISRGGFWAGSQEIFVCQNCSEKLLHVVLDAEFDSAYFETQIRVAKEKRPELMNLFRQKHDEWLLLASRVFWYKAFLYLEKDMTKTYTPSVSDISSIEEPDFGLDEANDEA